MITLGNEIEKENVLTIDDLDCGDSFVILLLYWDGIYLMCDNDTFVEILTGDTYEKNERKFLPVRKINLTLVKK